MPLQDASSVPVGASAPPTIRVWRIALDDERVLTPTRLAWLDRQESARAERFHRHENAQRWRIAHIALRSIIADATERRPEEVTFTIGAHGKPALPGVGTRSFNLSHSDDVALVALGGAAGVGVDIEQVADGPDLSEVTATHFADEERAYIATLDATRQTDAFYRCWTRKEAIVKALGVGVGYDLQSFAVSLDAAPARLVRTDAALGECQSWTLVDLALDGPYVGALAVHARDADVSVSEWSPQ